MWQASTLVSRRDSGKWSTLFHRSCRFLLTVVCVVGLALGLLVFSRIVRPGRPGRVTRMPYESGMDPIHDTRRRFDVRFYLLAIAFLVFDVELLFLYPWAVFAGEQQGMHQADDQLQTKGWALQCPFRDGETGRQGDGGDVS